MAKKCSLKGVVVFDSGPKFADRYTVFIDKDVYGMSSNANMPNGVCMYIGSIADIEKGKHLGKRIDVKKLPKGTKAAICDRK